MNDNKKQWSERAIIERIKKYADGKVGTALRSVKNTINTTVIEAQKKYPQSYPIVPVTILGNYTDNFDSATGLTGPFENDAKDYSMSAASGVLSVVGSDDGADPWVYTGKTGGAWLSGNASFTVTVTIIDAGVVRLGSAGGIGITVGDFANEINFDGAGNLYFIWYESGVPHASIGLQAGDGSKYAERLYPDQYPTPEDPLYLKVTHSYAGSTHSMTFQYKFDSWPSWLTAESQTFEVEDSVIGWAGNLLDVGPVMGNVSSDPRAVQFDSIVVNYIPVTPVDDYAFIYVNGYWTRKANYVYVKDTNGDYQEIEPESGMLVRSTDDDKIYEYDGSDWVDTGEIHDQLHDIDSTSDHAGISGATEDNFLSADATGLPQDSGFNDTSYDDAGAATAAQAAAEATAAGALTTHSALDTGVHGVGSSDVAATSYIAALLAQLPAIFPTHTYAAATYLALAGGTMTGQLTVGNDIEITDPTKGIIMTDTQGTPHKWRLTLDGSGTPGLVWTDLGAA